jgi:hypothetical protein
MIRMIGRMLRDTLEWRMEMARMRARLFRAGTTPASKATD